MHDLFLRFSVDKLEQLAERIDTCLATLSEEQIWWRGADAQNAVGNLVLHLSGNLRQWIVSALGGAPDNRKRDEEFAAHGGATAQELQNRLRDTVREAGRVIAALTPEALTERVQVQKYDVTKLEAVYHVVEHFSQHTGQIIYATKLLTSARFEFYAHLQGPAHSERVP